MEQKEPPEQQQHKWSSFLWLYNFIFHEKILQTSRAGQLTAMGGREKISAVIFFNDGECSAEAIQSSKKEIARNYVEKWSYTKTLLNEWNKKIFQVSQNILFRICENCFCKYLNLFPHLPNRWLHWKGLGSVGRNWFFNPYKCLDVTCGLTCETMGVVA